MSCAANEPRTDASVYLQAIKMKRSDVLGEMLSKRPESAIAYRDADGRCLLHECACEDAVEELRLCLPYFESADVCDESGWTPLHVACASNRSACVRVLLDYGANPLLKVNKSENNTLHITATRGHVSCLAQLLQAVDNVDQENAYCFTPLACAVMSKRLEAARLLINKGARIGLKLPGCDTTILKIAFDNEDLVMAQLLLEHCPSLAEDDVIQEYARLNSTVNAFIQEHTK